MSKKKMEGSSSNEKHLEDTFMRLTLPLNEEEEVKPHFFKIIISPDIQLLRLRLPPPFIKENGDNLSGCAYLRAPKGKEHRVILFKRDGNLWFEDGWSHFCQLYSLAYGHFLVFRYQGNSRFNVFIFDTSCLEIKYPDFDTTSSDEEGDWVEGDEEKEEEESEDEDDDEPHGKGKMSANNDAFEKAEAFKFNNPRFIVLMTLCCTSREYRMWIPRRHSKKYMKNVSEESSLELHVDGKSWAVNLAKTKNNSWRINRTGWKTFVEDNNLKMNDACAFELINTDTMAYKVHIFRA